VELPHAERHYSERLHRMEGLGAYFLRPTVFGDLKRQVLRERFTAELNLPPSVHLYLCPQALARFHPAFDDVLVEILAKDRLAYLLLLNGRDRQVSACRMPLLTCAWRFRLLLDCERSSSSSIPVL
jgi:predicted O-linked N-acetylglucosamine transferase (SPINDLY family)